MLVGEHSSRVACQILESSQGFSTIFEKLLAVDIDSASKSERADLIKALWKRLNSSCGPLTILGCLPHCNLRFFCFQTRSFLGLTGHRTFVRPRGRLFASLQRRQRHLITKLCVAGCFPITRSLDLVAMIGRNILQSAHSHCHLQRRS